MQLRDQIINVQLNNAGPGPGRPAESKGGGALDYKGLRKILSSYSKTDVVKKQLDEKAGREFTTKRLDHTENMIDKILATVDELWFMMRNKGDGSGLKDSVASEESVNINMVAPQREEERPTTVTSSHSFCNQPKAHSDQMRKAPTQSFASAGEEDQLKIVANRNSFSVVDGHRPKLEVLATQHTRPQTTVSLQRTGSALKLSERPCTSPGLSYYITPKSKRRESISMLNSRRETSLSSATDSKFSVAEFDDNLVVYNRQSSAESREAKEETLEVNPTTRNTQFYQGRATAL